MAQATIIDLEPVVLADGRQLFLTRTDADDYRIRADIESWVRAFLAAPGITLASTALLFGGLWWLCRKAVEATPEPPVRKPRRKPKRRRRRSQTAHSR